MQYIYTEHLCYPRTPHARNVYFAVILASEVFFCHRKLHDVIRFYYFVTDLSLKNLIAAERLLLRVLRSRGMNEKLARMDWF